MPTRSFLADLESGLPLESGPRSSSTAGCANLSWSALRCTLSLAEEAARQLHLCVAWVSKESQKDYDAWNAAKKDDDLFGPLRPASRQHDVEPTAAAYAAAPAVHADFSRSQLTSLSDAQQRPEPLNPSGVPRHTTPADGAEVNTSASSPLWEDFRCSPTQPQHIAMAKQAQQAASPSDIVKGSYDWRQGASTDSTYLLLFQHGLTSWDPAHMPSLCTGVTHAIVKAKVLSPPNQPGVSLGGRPVNVDIADLSIGSILGKGSFAVVSLCIPLNLSLKWLSLVRNRKTL